MRANRIVVRRRANGLSILLSATFFVAAVTLHAQEYVLLGWSDLGMHSTQKDFSKMALSPPFSTISAQLIRRLPNQPPQVVVSGYRIEYSIPHNTYSEGKTNFWTYAQRLFGFLKPLSPNTGLRGKELKGTLDANGSFFRAVGIPVTPFPDTSLVEEKPYQLIHLVAKAQGSSAELATTDVVIPVSDEVGCVQDGCHASEDSILEAHTQVEGFNRKGPVLCVSCHASNLFGTSGSAAAKSLSFQMHDAHSAIAPENAITTCYKCHPGPKTQSLRDVMRTSILPPLVCQNCHGTLSVIAQSISNGRDPWLEEPDCGSVLCHGNEHAEVPGMLYRESKGHGGLCCAACHGGPHAILPTNQPNDNLQSIRLQGYAGTLRNCMVCHTTAPTGPGPHGLPYMQAKLVSDQIPKKSFLYQSVPQRFSHETEIKFDLAEESQVLMRVYNLMGRQVDVLVDNKLAPGTYSVTWNATGQPSGMYYYGIQTGRYTMSKELWVRH